LAQSRLSNWRAFRGGHRRRTGAWSPRAAPDRWNG